MAKKTTLSGKTVVFGLFGWPVRHTLSPAMHMAAFRACGLNAVYVPFPVAPEQVWQAVQSIRALGLGGVNVTIPHKKAVIAHLDGVRGVAARIGAVNTIALQGGRLIGYNTDAEGFLLSLRQDAGFSPKNRRVFLLGAGGSGEAVAEALAGAGVSSLDIADLDPRRARRLVRKVLSRHPGIDMRPLPLRGRTIRKLRNAPHLIVNATFAGMDRRDPSPVDRRLWERGMTAYDLVYQHETRLVREARTAGCRACGGLGMLLRQGARSFEIWTGRRAPLRIMQKALRAALAGR